LLTELGIAFESVTVDIFAGGGGTPDYRRINPTGKVPFLEDGEIGIFESGAILIYLADKYGSGKIAPTLEDSTRAEYLQWLFFAQTTIEGPATRLFANRTFLKNQPDAEERAKSAIKELHAKVPIVRDVLAAKKYLLGDSLTAADIMLGSALFWIASAGGLEDFPVLAAYLQRLRERPAFELVFGT